MTTATDRHQPEPADDAPVPDGRQPNYDSQSKKWYWYGARYASFMAKHRHGVPARLVPLMPAASRPPRPELGHQWAEFSTRELALDALRLAMALDTVAVSVVAVSAVV